MNKNIFLTLIAIMSMASAAFASLPQAQVPSVGPNKNDTKKEAPYALSKGLQTVLMKSSTSLGTYLYVSPHRTPLNNVIIFNTNIKPIMTLEELRLVDTSYEQKVQDQANLIVDFIKKNQGIVCPEVISQKEDSIDVLKSWIMGGKKEKVPAIVIGTRDPNKCRSVADYFSKLNQKKS